MKELSLYILDITQNSITAGAKNIDISLVETESTGTLEISIRDDGCGMSEETLKKVTDPFFTSRTTRKVGLGIPLYKMAAEQTGGSFHINSELGRGTVNNAVFMTGSIDMPPLGDIISTITILIQGAPDIDFVFNHIKAERTVTLGTLELRETLGRDISLSEPDVIEWIQGYLTESYEGLR